MTKCKTSCVQCEHLDQDTLLCECAKPLVSIFSKHFNLDLKGINSIPYCEMTLPLNTKVFYSNDGEFKITRGEFILVDIRNMFLPEVAINIVEGFKRGDMR